MALRVARLSAEPYNTGTTVRVARVSAESVQDSTPRLRIPRLEAIGQVPPDPIFAFVGGTWRLCTLHIFNNGAWEAL